MLDWETWRSFGNYTGGCCPNCDRDRLILATDPLKNDRVICEKCDFEPDANDYSRCVDIAKGEGK